MNTVKSKSTINVTPKEWNMLVDFAQFLIESDLSMPVEDIIDDISNLRMDFDDFDFEIIGD